ncbi:hypothetical protein ASPBRDRAFT_55575 [Aspergillus brasiliensis CBS 101740]|uniref:Uncharacterized protein n=1 Tax=Aspergillus brasiliensis (strain CBS 101740 / IMI 381727 / IBT 21946) TaxID=767769 RepID=A0A1L9UGY6_ASPBC|nr:hypothetical protein ASPBRDRAFT_55575 [Aspergillus brasiliensis CBS 101740]
MTRPREELRDGGQGRSKNFTVARLTRSRRMTPRRWCDVGEDDRDHGFFVIRNVLKEWALLHESERPQLFCNSRFGTDPVKTTILVLTFTESCSETYPAVIESKRLEVTGVNSTNLKSDMNVRAVEVVQRVRPG